MAEQIYQESNYRFTDPIRFFKANDPYYFEVDNIPIKQLEENCLWLRDQLTKTTDQIQSGSTSVNRADFNELKPYATGTDRVVRIKPGRFSARINDIGSKDPLEYLIKVLGTELGDVDSFSFATNNTGTFGVDFNTKLQAALLKFQQTISSAALGMTGLEERSFTWPVYTQDVPAGGGGSVPGSSSAAVNYGNTPSPGIAAKYSPGLISQALLWAKSKSGSEASFTLPLYSDTTGAGFSRLPFIESYLLKKWRGVTRFSIVDVPEELAIQIPTFDSQDFEYLDSAGSETSLASDPQTRIDMVFLYAKPVDSSGVRVVSNNSVNTITKPAIGLIRGAGIKFSQAGVNDVLTGTGPVNAFDADGNPMILASPGDQENSNMGFTSASGNDILEDVRGSFPAPDDLLNIAPLLSERLEDNAFELLGQSILPIAYVVVRNAGQSELNNASLVNSTDVIDIRPFFRTAELTYNERAGIAAANPQLSLANPAVGKAELQKTEYELKEYIDNAIKVEVPESGGSTITTVATGYVFGGFFFGPESCLYDFNFDKFIDEGADQVQTTKNYVKNNYFGLDGETTNIDIPDYPDWDLAEWCLIGDSFNDKGEYPNDYINVFVNSNPDNQGPDNAVVAGSYAERVLVNGLDSGGNIPSRINNFNGKIGFTSNTPNGSGGVEFAFIRKTIFFDRDSIPTGMNDYDIDISFVNCLPQNYKGNAGTADYAGHWIEKRKNSFTIYIAIPCKTQENDTNADGYPSENRSTGLYSRFITCTEDILFSDTSKFPGGGSFGNLLAGYVGNPRVGICTYPTIMWKMTSIPANKTQFHNGALSNTDGNITIGV